MRCPECNRTQQYKEGMRCRRCGYKFVFNPKSTKYKGQIRDYTLRSIIKQLSNDGQYCFTRTQLAVEISRYWDKRHGMGCLLVLGSLALAGFVGFLTSAINDSEVRGWIVGSGLFVILLALGFGLKLYKKGEGRVSFKEANAVIETYHRAYPIKPLITGKAFTGESETDFYFEPDRILMVERDNIADMLVLNRFPQQTKTAVVSRRGYPEHVFAACRTFLAKNPQLPVYVMHDASLMGFRRIAILGQDERWRFARDNFVDIGLAKRHFNERTPALPWLKDGKADIVFTANYDKMLTAGARMPIDYAPPKFLLNLLANAVLTGSLLLPVQ